MTNWLTGWTYRQSHIITESVAPAGTVTVTNGNKNVTGSSTNLITASAGGN